MNGVTVTWSQGQQFVGTDSTKHSVVIASPADGAGMKPSELLLLSLAACTAYDVVNILLKRRAKLTDLRITVSGDQAPDPPWSYQKIHIHYQVTGRGLDPKAVERAITLSREKYCSVSATLAGPVDIARDWESLEAAD
jgi:putative redox protein